MITQISFFILGILAIATTLVMLTRRWPVSSAMLLIVVMILIAGMYGLMGADFSAASQIIVYAGAIMVVFIFVIMLLNLPPEEMKFSRITIFEIILIILGIIAALFLGTKVGHGYLLKSLYLINARLPYYPESLNEGTKNVSALMFTDYLWAFELISFLILAAIIGAVVIAKKAEVSNAKSS